MTSIAEIVAYLDQLAPPELAESWDNVGLLIGDGAGEVRSVMTCLTVSERVVTEAIEGQVDLLIAHHPLPFRPLARITADRLPGRHVWRLARAGVSLYSAHTAFDSAEHGLNQRIAERLRLDAIGPLRPIVSDSPVPPWGAGRQGQLPQPESLRRFADRVKNCFRVERLRVAGDPDRDVATIAIACGSGGEFLEDALRRECDVLLTGEATFHTVQHGVDSGIALVLTGHYASERFGMEELAAVVADAFPHLSVIASQAERAPWQTW